MGHAVPAEIVHIGVHVGERHRAHQGQIHVVDGDLIHGRVPGHHAAVPLKEAEKVAQIQIVFVHGPGRMALDGLMVSEKIADDSRRLGTIVQ